MCTGALHTCLLNLRIIYRKTHACNQIGFLHQNSCKRERHWQSPCNHICQVSNEEFCLQSLTCQRSPQGGHTHTHLYRHTIHQQHHITTPVLYLIHSKVFATSGLFHVAIGVFAFIYFVMAFLRPRLTSFLPTSWKVVFIFQSLHLSRREVLPFSLFIYLYLFCTPPGIYPIIIVTWTISDREELSFENQTPASKHKGKETLFWFSLCTLFVETSSLHMWVFLVTYIKNISMTCPK